MATRYGAAYGSYSESLTRFLPDPPLATSAIGLLAFVMGSAVSRS